MHYATKPLPAIPIVQENKRNKDSPLFITHSVHSGNLISQTRSIVARIAGIVTLVTKCHTSHEPCVWPLPPTHVQGGGTGAAGNLL